jgi:hypothetical protein
MSSCETWILERDRAFRDCRIFCFAVLGRAQIPSLSSPYFAVLPFLPCDFQATPHFSRSRGNLTDFDVDTVRSGRTLGLPVSTSACALEVQHLRRREIGFRTSPHSPIQDSSSALCLRIPS